MVLAVGIPRACNRARRLVEQACLLLTDLSLGFESTALFEELLYLSGSLILLIGRDCSATLANDVEDADAIWGTADPRRIDVDVAGESSDLNDITTALPPGIGDC